jgi:hypothetical protein
MHPNFPKKRKYSMKAALLGFLLKTLLPRIFRGSNALSKTTTLSIGYQWRLFACPSDLYSTLNYQLYRLGTIWTHPGRVQSTHASASARSWKDVDVHKNMEILLKLFYIALFIAIIFFGPLQEYLYKKKSQWDLKKNSREPKTDKTPIPADPEKMGSMLALVLIVLALAFFIWKILTTAFTAL